MGCRRRVFPCEIGLPRGESLPGLPPRTRAVRAETGPPFTRTCRPGRDRTPSDGSSSGTRFYFQEGPLHGSILLCVLVFSRCELNETLLNTKSSFRFFPLLDGFCSLFRLSVVLICYSSTTNFIHFASSVFGGAFSCGIAAVFKHFGFS